MAVLADALCAISVAADAGGLARVPRRRRKAAAEALAWVCDRRSVGLFAFRTICGELGLNAEQIRRRAVASLQPAPPRPVSEGGR